jgi:hypothetical protein
MHSFPTELLYSKAPGLNLDQLSDTGILSKLALILRGLKYEKSINQYIHGFFHRAARFCGLSLCKGEAFVLQYTPQHYHFLSSILERLAECKLFLAMGGTDVTGTTQEQILTYNARSKGTSTQTSWTTQNINMLEKLNVHTVGDILTNADNRNKWFDEQTLNELGLSFLNTWIGTRTAPSGPTLLRQQSCWLRPEHNDILEYLGQTPLPGTNKLGLMFRKWDVMKQENILEAKKVQLSTETPSMLAGTNLILNYRQVWPKGTPAQRCILSEDQLSSNKQIIRFIRHKYTVSQPVVGNVRYIVQPNSTLSPILQMMKQMNFTSNGYKIYTDGGWSNQTDTLCELLYGKDTSKYQATGAVCLIKEDDSPYETKEIVTIHLTNHKRIPLTSAYPTELLSMIFALHLTKVIKPINICTDAESVKKVIDKRKKLKQELLKDYSILVQHLYHIIDSDKTKNVIHFQRAHMDEVHPESELTPDEWGNVLADKVASNDMDYVRQRCKNFSHFTIDFSDFIQQDIRTRLKAHLVNEEGLVHLTALSETFKQNHFQKYSVARTLVSERGDFWSTTTYALATKVWNLKNGDLTERSSSTRIIFNKLWQPWNQKRFASDPLSVTDECVNCGLKDSYEHLLCQCPHPQIQQLVIEGKHARDKLYAYAEDETTKAVYQILETMLTQQGCANIYISLWSTDQVINFTEELNKCNIHLDSKTKRALVAEAILTYSCLLASNTKQMVQQRLRINRNAKKRYGPATHKQYIFEQRHSDTWKDYEKRIRQTKPKKRRPKTSPHQLLINDNKFNVIRNKLNLARQNNYERPILTCAEYKIPDWTNDVPYLDERENVGAKIENQYQRHLSWDRHTYPKKPTLPTSTDATEVKLRDEIKKRELRYRRFRKKLLHKPHFLKMFCEHHGLDYNDLSTNNSPLPPPILDHG